MAPGTVLRLRITVRGAVQGVGFRPMVYRLATSLNLPGWVNNSTEGVFIEVEGPRTVLEQFLLGLEIQKPPHSSIQSPKRPGSTRRLLQFGSPQRPASRTTLVLPISPVRRCPWIFDPADRRYGYPFTNCTNAAPVQHNRSVAI
jgi:hydrogenase maturation protein HypF